MWLFTKEGFFSIVQDKQESELLWIRARRVDDITRLLESVPLTPRTVLSRVGTDYEHRIPVNRDELSRVMLHASQSVDYSNFKDEASKSLGYARASVYSRVWWELQSLSDDVRGPSGR